MLAFRIVRVCAHLLAGIWTSALVFPLTDAAGRAWRIKNWSSKLLAICGVTTEITYAINARSLAHALIVANHVSWLDIFVINSMAPCRFVAKSDVRDWPIIGWLSSQAGTIYISRGRARDVRRIFEGLVASIHAGERVAFFPEGTTAGQGGVLPFHANLFEAAIDAQVPIQPFALRYTDAAGNLQSVVDFVGDMSFAQSMIAILKVRKINAHLTVLPVIDTTGTHRRELALASRHAIATALGYPEK